MSDSAESIGAMMRETAARVFAEACGTEVQRAADSGTFPSAAWAAIAEAGLHRALLPEAAGGYGVPVAEALTILRVAGEHALPLPLAETMLAQWLLASAGIEVPDGILTVAYGDGLSLQGGRLTGSAERVPWGRDADATVVLVGGETPRCVLVQRGGWSVEAGQNVAREPRDTLRFDTSEIVAGAMTVDAKMLRAAGAAVRTQQIAGALTGVVAMTTQYAMDRVQFGRPIGKFQAVQQNLASMAGQTAASVAAADIAADAMADGVRILPIAAAKARAGEAAGISAAIAHQVHGAIGFTLEHNLQFLTRRLWSWRDEFGNETEWNRVVGSHMVRAGGARLWEEIVAA